MTRAAFRSAYHGRPPVYGLRHPGTALYFNGMAERPDPSLSILTALASAAATAYALAYVAHSEWGISRIRIREDALVLAALLAAAMTARIVLQRKRNKGS
jgi:hypothetical protein